MKTFTHPIKTILFFLFWITLSFTSLQAQHNEKLNEIQRLERRKLIDQLNNQAYHSSRRGESDKSRHFIQDALKLSAQNNYLKGTGYAHWNSGYLHWFENNLEKALPDLQSALKIFTAINDTLGLARTNDVLLSSNLGLKKYDEAIEYGLTAIELYDRQTELKGEGVDTLKALSLTQIAFGLRKTKKLEQAKQYAEEALVLGELYNNAYAIAYALIYLGDIACSENNCPLGYEHHIRAYNIYRNIKWLRHKNDLTNLGYLMYKTGYYYWYFDHDINRGKPLMEKSIQVFEQLENYRRLVWTYVYIAGLYYEVEHDPVKATDYYMMALAISEKHSETLNERIHIHKALGHLNLFLNDDEALKQYTLAKELSIETHGDHELANAILGIAAALRNKGDINKSSENYWHALSIGQKIRDAHIISRAYMNLLHNEEKVDYDSALFYLQERMEIELLQGDTSAVYKTMNSMANCYWYQGKYSESLDYATKALGYAKKFDDLNFQSYISNTIKISHAKLENYKEALEYAYLESDLNDSIHKRELDGKLTEIQLKYNKEKDDAEIRRLKNENIIYELEQERLSMLHNSMEQRLEILSNEKKLHDVLMEHAKSDLLLKENQVKASKDSLELLQKDAVIQQLALRKQKLTRNYAFAGIGILGLMSLLVYNNYVTRHRLKLQTLRNKIASDLHDDVGSTLSSIHIFSEIARNQSKEVIPMLDTIGDSSRKMLDAMADIVWTIHPENDDFEKILDRMRSFAYELLGAKKIEFEFEANEDLTDLKLSMEMRKNLYLIFKEATNNMVKYSNADKAHFSLKEENKNLIMSIRDNGKGFDMSRTATGNGLKNMQKRAEEIGGKLWIESKQNEGTTIRLKVAV